MLSPLLSLAFLPFFPPRFLYFKYFFSRIISARLSRHARARGKKITFPAGAELRRPRKGTRLWRTRWRLPGHLGWHGVAGGGCGLQRQANPRAFSSLLAAMWGRDSLIPHPPCGSSSGLAGTRSGACAEPAGRAAQGENVGL